MKFFCAALSCCLLFVPPSLVSAAPVVVEAGQTHALTEDLVLNGTDTLEIKGTADKPCSLVGNRHRVRSGDNWTGALKITHCTIKDLGGLQKRNDTTGLITGNGPTAFDLKVGGKGGITIENCTLDACSAIHLQTNDNTMAGIRNNTILDTSVVAITKNVEHSGEAFSAGGNSKERKVFQGNFVPRGK